MTPPALPLLPSPAGAEGYVALDKPAGLAVHGPGGVLAAARESLGAELSLVHRLDRITSGVLLLARGEEALAAAHAAWAERVTKTYLALVRGTPDPPEGVVTAPLLEHHTSRPDLLRRALRAAYGPGRAGKLLAGQRVGGLPPVPSPGTTAVHPKGRPAETGYRLLAARGELSLVACRPRTGRMHQVRVHLLHLGTPVAFDPLYDPAWVEGSPRAFLHAWRLEWRDPPGAAGGGVWSWEAPASPPGGGWGMIRP